MTAAAGGEGSGAGGRGCLPIVVAAVILAVVVGVVVTSTSTTRTGPPFDPRSTSPSGTAALVELLKRSGARVDVPDSFPPDRGVDTAVVFSVPVGLPADGGPGVPTDLTPDQQLRQWVEAGHTLVVADPTSELTPEARLAGPPVGTSPAIARGDCDLAPLEPLTAVKPSRPYSFQVVPGAGSCFPADNGGSFVTSQAVGRGRVVSVGDADVFTNALLGEEDNAALAVGLLAPSSGTRTAVLRSQVFRGAAAPDRIGGDVWELVGPGGRFFVAELAVAVLVYGWFRGRRLGRPVLEPQPVQIAGSELVGAMGNLLARTGDPANAARVLRSSLRGEVTSRLGLPPDATPDVLAEAVALRTGRSPAEVLPTVADLPLSGEGDLVELARRIESIREEVLHGTAP